MAKNVLINEEYVWTHKGGILKLNLVGIAASFLICMKWDIQYKIVSHIT